MKKRLYIFLAILLASCSEESPIEGLTAAKPSVVAVNAEIAAGNSRTFTLTVNGQTFQMDVSTTSASSNGVEGKDCVLAFRNNACVFTQVPGTPYISPATAGAAIAAPMFSAPTYSGVLYFVARQLNSTEYNYANSNGVRFGNTYYIPFKVVPGSGQREAVFAYLQISVATDKVFFHKMVYRTMGQLSAGGE